MSDSSRVWWIGGLLIAGLTASPGQSLAATCDHAVIAQQIDQFVANDFSIVDQVVQCGEAAVSPLLAALNSQREMIRSRSAFALAQIRYNQALPAQTTTVVVQTLTVRLRDDPSGLVRTNAASALAAFGQDAVVALPQLLETLQTDPFPNARAQAAHALGEVGADPLQVVPPLTDSLADPAMQVRLGAAETLGALGLASQASVPALIHLLDDLESEVRTSSAWALGEIADALYDEATRDPVGAIARIDDAITVVESMSQALSGPDFESARQPVERNLRALQSTRQSLRLDLALRWVNRGRTVGVAHAGFWLALIFLYPRFRVIQAIFFWNPWVRNITGLGYVGFILTWVPFLRRKLFEPFRASLLADAGLEHFNPRTYFPHTQVIGPQGGDPQPIIQAIPALKGQIVLEGASGLGKTMFLRYLCHRSTQIVVYLPAAKCANGVIEAIQRKLHGEEIQDSHFLQNLIYSGAIAICIDGLNEVNADTRAKIVDFAENYFKGDIILATQPMEWRSPSTARQFTLQPLNPDQIQTFLTSRQGVIFEDAPVQGMAYRQACEAVLADAFYPNQTPEERRANQMILSNPMDLTLVATLIASGHHPDLFHLQEQQYQVMAKDYRDRHRQEFPLMALAEAVYQMRLADQSVLDESQFANEIRCMDRYKMVVSRPFNQADGESAQVWRFRHDKIAEFFILHAFRSQPDRQVNHLGDPRFRGVYFLLAHTLPLEDAIALRELLIHHAADHKDHTVSDPFVQLLRSRSV